jgi:virginiamycin B lyase
LGLLELSIGKLKDRRGAISLLTVAMVLMLALPVPQGLSNQTGKAVAGVPIIIAQSSPSFITNYTIPGISNPEPDAIVAGPNHALWFTEYGNGSIGEFNSTSRVFANYTIPERGTIPVTLTFDGPGEIWFTDQNPSSPSIWLFNITGTKTFQQFATNVKNSGPVFVLADPSTRNIWFTDTTGDYLGEINHASHQMTKFPAPTAYSGPVELAFQNGTSYIWLSEISGKIARFDETTLTFQEYDPTVPLSYPVGIVLDKNNNVWVSEHGGSGIVQFASSNSTWRKYPTSQATAPPGSGPATLAIDSQGRLWFAEHYAGKIGRLDPSTGLMEEYTIPFTGAYSLLNSFDSSGNFWFAMAYANSIGMIPGNSTTAISIRPTAVPSSSVVSGSSFVSQFNITNNLPTQVSLDLGVTSFFTTNYYTTSSEISISRTRLTLNSGGSAIISATVTPDFSLSSGIYTAGIVASYGSVASVGTFFLQVATSPWYTLVTFLPEIMIVAAVVLAVVFFLFRRRRKQAFSGASKPPPKLSLLFSLILLFLFLIQETGESWAKCPGLPPPPVNPNGTAVDYYGIALDVGSLVFFGIVAYLLIRSRFRGNGQPQDHGTTSH